MMKKLIQTLLMGSVMIIGLSACGTKRDVDVTLESTEQSSFAEETKQEETTEVASSQEVSTEEQIETNQHVTMSQIPSSGCISVEEIISIYIDAIGNEDWDTVVSLRPYYVVDTFIISEEGVEQENYNLIDSYTSEEYLKMLVDMDDRSDGVYHAYVNKNRTDLVGTPYNWNRSYECLYETIEEDFSEELIAYQADLEEVQGTLKFIQTCVAKVVVESPVFYPDEADYYDSVLSFVMMQDANEKWYLIHVGLEGKVKEYDDISQWNEIEAYQTEWMPVLTQLMESEYSDVQEWSIDNAYADTATSVQDTAIALGIQISSIFNFEIKMQMEEGNVEYKTVTIMCSNGQWSVLH